MASQTQSNPFGIELPHATPRQHNLEDWALARAVAKAREVGLTVEFVEEFGNWRWRGKDVIEAARRALIDLELRP